MKEQWQELKETITEMRDNDGTGTQHEVCKFLANLMNVLEKQMWIPVSKRLPEEKNWYIVTKGFGKYHWIDDAYFDGETWLERRAEWRKLVYAYDIIAWMSKPQPYYEEEKVLEQEDVFDKIKAEVEKLPVTDTAVRLVTEILDKYKAESEEEE